MTESGNERRCDRLEVSTLQELEEQPEAKIDHVHGQSCGGASAATRNFTLRKAPLMFLIRVGRLVELHGNNLLVGSVTYGVSR